jgi:hypothetical protein
MRKRYRVLILAAIIAAVVVPVGFALSQEADSPTIAPVAPGEAVVATIATATPVVLTGEHASGFEMPSIPDGAKLLVIGTVLCGIAAAMRRAA